MHKLIGNFTNTAEMHYQPPDFIQKPFFSCSDKNPANIIYSFHQWAIDLHSFCSWAKSREVSVKREFKVADISNTFRNRSSVERTLKENFHKVQVSAAKSP